MIDLSSVPRRHATLLVGIDGPDGGALDRRLRDAYDYSVWVEAPPDVRFRRGIERDGEAALPLWEAWSEKEQRYWAEQQPREAAVVVDGSGL